MNIAQSNMVKQQLRTGNVLDNQILGLYHTLPRENFVPRQYKQFAYSDFQIPLSNNQKMLTPLEEATIIQSLGLTGTENVLEIGTGCGYLTALLAQCAKEVISIEYFVDIAKLATENLEKYKIDNAQVFVGDGHRGWLDEAPYDVIVVSGSVPQVVDIFKPQLMKQGKMFVIIGSMPVMHGTLLTLSDDELWQETVLFDTTVEPLTTPNKESVFNF